ncbi:MAG: tRNA uridine-5-carboxymethylaminomethyl(34) synthesis enzyme MnmG, partial [Bacilli bacterium]
KKGPAVRALRAQADKITYPKEMLKTLKKQSNLDLLEDMVDDLIIEDKKVKGVVLESGKKIYSQIVILTTGTYMKADIIVGSTRTRKGPNNQKPSENLSDNLKRYGFKILRLKTGTPQRLDKLTIDFSKTTVQLGDSEQWAFSIEGEPTYNPKYQEPCYLIYTNQKTHDIIKKNLNKSSIYGGRDDIEGIGPRYCPSIEDKVVRFANKERHQLFLEPESKYYNDIYLQGFSTSMPHEIQDEMVHSLPGLENVKILKYAYAIEYDAIYPTQIWPSLETKIIENLYTAGQINGTSGYEEAACQGLMAGINASLKLENKQPLILKRNEAYVGVLIDDLVTKGTKEPYRLLTSRAEHRLLLRHDNADLRLREYGHKVELINDKIYNRFLKKKKKTNELITLLSSTKITPNQENNEFLESIESSPLKDGIYLIDLLKRPEIIGEHIKELLKIEVDKDILDQIEINIKYEGYIKKAQKEVEKMLELESKKIPLDINYDNIHNLANEAKQKLKEIKPSSIGQASRISGVNPADISILMIYLKKTGGKNE